MSARTCRRCWHRETSHFGVARGTGAPAHCVECPRPKRKREHEFALSDREPTTEEAAEAAAWSAYDQPADSPARAHFIHGYLLAAAAAQEREARRHEAQ